MIAELCRDGLAFLDLDGLGGNGLSRLDGSGLGGIVQQVAGLGPGLLDDQRGAGGDALNQEGPVGVRHKLAVAVAHHSAVRRSHKKLHITQRAAVGAGHLLDQDGPLGCVGKIERYNVLLLAADVEGLGRAVDDVGPVAFYLLTDVVAGFQAGNCEGAVGGGHIVSDDGAATAADLAA